ncbi:unnamed protein product [Cuscuta campestris]|uniref:Uncharacterized protein n=1 Tax=Cuscuta campestris TaxID=132261 RepID=A0A484N5C6_9ASTE|nr:unnamed protein product [Cuscuta campestris]
MAVAMAGILTIFVIERVDEKKGVLSLIPFLLCGVGSVFYWRYTGDLRPYAAVETIPAIVVVLMAILIPPKYTHSTYWLWAAESPEFGRPEAVYLNRGCASGFSILIGVVVSTGLWFSL